MAKPKKQGAPEVGIYLRIGPDLALDILIPKLRQFMFVINNSDYERNMHALELFGNEKDKEFLEKAALIVELCKNNGIVPLLRGKPKSAKEIDAEGIVLTDMKDLKKAKKLLSDESIIGLACGDKKENAAEAHDADLDFVTFARKDKGSFPNPETLRFWTILSDKPAVIEGPIDNDYVSYFVKQGAGFIEATDYILGHPEGVMKGTVNILHAIELATEKQAVQ